MAPGWWRRRGRPRRASSSAPVLPLLLLFSTSASPSLGSSEAPSSSSSPGASVGRCSGVLTVDGDDQGESCPLADAWPDPPTSSSSSSSSTSPPPNGGGTCSWVLRSGKLSATIERTPCDSNERRGDSDVDDGVELSAASRRGGGLLWGGVTWEGSVGNDTYGCADELPLGALFGLRSSKHAGAVFSWECKLIEDPVLLDVGMRFEAQLDCPGQIRVAFSATMQTLPSSGGTALRWRVSLTGKGKAQRLAVLLARQPSCSTASAASWSSSVAAESVSLAHSTGTVDGSPLRTEGGRFLFAAEHPLAKHHRGREAAAAWPESAPLAAEEAERLPWPHAAIAELVHLGDLRKRRKGSRPLEYGAVVVAVAEPETQTRRTFAEYLMAARHPGAWQGPLLHYNSWYDFHSWQDEGFFGGAPGFEKLLEALRKEPMNELGAMKRISGFTPLIRRGVQLDSFLLDDGWDDPRALWTIDAEKFPEGFANVAAHAKRFGSGLSTWLSPWGGYGEAKDERLRLGRKQGFETNEQGFSLAGKKYSARFKAAIKEFRERWGVNMLKLDGVAGDPSELPAEVEAMLDIIRDLRSDGERSSKSSVGDGENSSEQGDDDKGDSIWINLTTGTWPSPFFILWVDSIWRGHTDTSVPKSAVLDGLSRRQRWQVWRECIVHERIVRRASLFPISRLMVHGAVLAAHGDALANGLHDMDPVDWAQEVWSLAAMGLQLQELYISAKLMTDWAWDELAAALHWARNNSKVLEDAHWAIPATCLVLDLKDEDAEFLPYAIGAYSGDTKAGGAGFLMVRNPRSSTQRSPKFSLASALELPASEAPRSFAISVVRRITVAGAGAAEKVAFDCARLGVAASQAVGGRCSVPSGHAHLNLELAPGELLVLRTELLDQPRTDFAIGA